MVHLRLETYVRTCYWGGDRRGSMLEEAQEKEKKGEGAEFRSLS